MKSKKTNSRIYLMVNILVAVFFTIIFGVLCALVIHYQDEDMRQKNYQQMDDAISDLRYRLETENNINSEKVSESLRLFVHFMRQSGQITEEKDSVLRQTTNFETGETSYERVPRWTDGVPAVLTARWRVFGGITRNAPPGLVTGAFPSNSYVRRPERM